MLLSALYDRFVVRFECCIPMRERLFISVPVCSVQKIYDACHDNDDEDNNQKNPEPSEVTAVIFICN